MAKTRKVQKARATTRQAPATADALRKLVQAVELDNVHLLRSEGVMRPAQLDSSAESSMRVEHRPTQYRVQVNNDGRLLYCGLKLGLDVVTDAKEVEAVLSIEAEYLIIYRLAEGSECSPVVANEFAARNAVFNAWPFFRELTHSLVARMNMPPLMLPLLRLPPTAPR